MTALTKPEKNSKKSNWWSADEVDQLEHAMTQVCAAHQLTLEELLRVRASKKVKRSDGIWVGIAKNFPHRNEQTVYRKGCRILEQRLRTTGPWSEEEKVRLIELVQLHGTKWAKIAPMLNRTSESCYDKYRECQKDYKTGDWDKAETERFQTIIDEFTNKNGKDKESSQLPWTVISERMGNRSRLACFAKWQIMTGQDRRSASFHKQRQEKAAARKAAKAQRSREKAATKKAASAQKSRAKANDEGDKATLLSPQLLEQIHLSLEKRLHLESDWQTVTIKDLRQALEEEFAMIFSKQLRRLVKKCVKEILLASNDSNNSKVPVVVDVSKRQDGDGNDSGPTAAPEGGGGDGSGGAIVRISNNRKRKGTNTASMNDSDHSTKRRKATSDNVKTDVVPSEVTVKNGVSAVEISLAMQQILLNANKQRMKPKALRRALKAKYRVEKRKTLKKLMKQVLAEDNFQQFQSDGKRLFVVESSRPGS